MDWEDSCSSGSPGAVVRSRRALLLHHHNERCNSATDKIKQMWRAGQYVTMGWLSISHGFTAEVMARQGFDTYASTCSTGRPR